MSDVLTQAEIDELLKVMLAGGTVEEKKTSAVEDKKTHKNDFKLPKKLKKGELEKIKRFTEKFVWELCQYYSNILNVKNSFKIELLALELLNFADFNNGITDDSVIFVIDICGKTNYMYLEMPLGLCSALNGISNIQPLANLSADNRKKIISTAEAVCGIFECIIRNNLDNQQLQVGLRSMENIRTFIPSVYYSETVGLLILKVAIDGFVSQFNICMPFHTLNYIASTFNADRVDDTLMFEQLSDMSLDVEFLLGRSKVCLNDLNSLGIGDIILLDSRVKDNRVEVLVDNSVLYYGRLGINEDRYAVKITEQR